MTEQGYSGDRHPPTPPTRPSLATGATPSEIAARPRPRLVGVSYRLWLGACLAGVITAAVTLIYFGELKAEMLSIVERDFPRETPSTRNEVATAAVATLIGTGVLVVLAQMAFAIAMHSGRGWARYPLVLLALLGTLYSVVVFGAAPMVTKVGLLATTALMVIAVVPMFLTGARTWFAQRLLHRPSS